MKKDFVDRAIFFKNFALEYPEFIRFLKKYNIYKTFFRAMRSHGYQKNIKISRHLRDWDTIRDIVDRAFLWDIQRNDGMDAIKWSEIKLKWRGYIISHIRKDEKCRQKINRAVWKTHMAMYKGQPWERFKVAIYDILKGNF